MSDEDIKKVATCIVGVGLALVVCAIVKALFPVITIAVIVGVAYYLLTRGKKP